MTCALTMAWFMPVLRVTGMAWYDSVDSFRRRGTDMNAMMAWLGLSECHISYVYYGNKADWV